MPAEAVDPVAALQSWDGTATDASRLREMALECSVPPGRPADGTRGLHKLLAAYRKPEGAARLTRWLADHPDEAQLVAPWIGDPALGPWPWSDPLEVDEPTALAALRLLGAVRVPVDDEIRVFLRVFLRTRPRASWCAAARAMAKQAVTDAPLRAHITALWAAAFPGRVQLGDGQTRLRRHVLFLGACAVGFGVEILGFDPVELAGRRPVGDADWSVWILALAEHAHTPGVAEGLQAQLASLGNHPLSERAWRDVQARLPPGLQSAVRDRLAVERWTDADGLLAWLDPADGATHGTPFDVVDRLAALFHPDRGPLWGPRERALAVVELARRLRSPALADVPWGNLARAAGQGLPELPGRCAEVGLAALGVCTALAGWPVQALLRETTFGVEGALVMARLTNGFVATQVALEIDEALRTHPDPADRVRLLWRLLQADPPTRTFEELEDVLRSDAPPGAVGSGPLIELVRAIRELDRLRDAAAPARELSAAIKELAGRVEAVRGAPARPLFTLVDALDVPSQPLSTELTDRLEGLLGAGEVGIIGWNCWVLGRDRDAELRWSSDTQRAVASLRRAIEALVEARPRALPEHVAELNRACSEVDVVVEACGWPERFVVHALLDQARSAAGSELERGHQSRRLATRLDRHVRLGDDDAVRRLVSDPAVLDLLGVHDLRRVQSFLLDQLCWRAASALRRAVGDRVALPSPSRHLTPLFAAVAGGSFLVLDFGGDWVDMARQGAGGRYALTVALTFTMSFVVLTATLGTHFVSPGRAGARWLRAAVRTIPVFLVAGAVALSVSALVAATLEDTPIAVLPVFAGLAMFLGVFVGLVLQGGRTGAMTDDRS